MHHACVVVEQHLLLYLLLSLDLCLLGLALPNVAYELQLIWEAHVQALLGNKSKKSCHCYMWVLDSVAYCVYHLYAKIKNLS